jgi:hypothetical protein
VKLEIVSFTPPGLRAMLSKVTVEFGRFSQVTIVAVEQSPWLTALIAMLQTSRPDVNISIVAPWANSRLVESFAARISRSASKYPQMLKALPQLEFFSPFVARRTPSFPTTDHSLRWQTLQLALRIATHRSSARRFHSNFIERRALAKWAMSASSLLNIVKPGSQSLGFESHLVIAPSLAARELIACVNAAGASSAVFLDMPYLQTMHRDLDAASALQHGDRYLQHFRAPGWAIARQRAELHLADFVLVRGDYVGNEVSLQNPDAHVIKLDSAASYPGATSNAIEFDPSPNAPLLLAGIAAARNGCWPALQAAQQTNRILFVRRGEATEPTFAQQPGLHWINDTCPPIGALVAPAICESYVRIDTAPAVRRIGSPCVSGVTEFCEPTTDALVRSLQRSSADS